MSKQSMPLSSQLKADLLIELKKQKCRLNFWSFCLFYDPDFFNKRGFLKQVAEAFMKLFKGEIKTLAVSMPPRAGKSYITSLYCAWWLARNNQLCVMRNTVTSSLYRKFSYDIRDIIKSNKFKEIFPSVELQPDKQNIDGWSLTTSKQGAYFGGGVGTNIIGFGANLAITDDLYSGFDQALSEVYNEGVHQWKQGSHNSRMEKNCPEIYIGTRWSKSDVIGKAIEDGKIDCNIVIQALDEKGNSFCEEVKTTIEYNKLKSETDSSIWDAEYQQEPADAKGQLFPKDSIKYFIPSDYKDAKWETSTGYVDVADEGTDNLSFPVAKSLDKRLFITDWMFTKENADNTRPMVAEQIRVNDIMFTRIESNNMGAIFGRDVKKLVPDHVNVRLINNDQNKHTRIIMASGLVLKYCHFVHPDYQSDQYKQAMNELTKYMRESKGSVRDDAPDSLSGLVVYVRELYPHLFA